MPADLIDDDIPIAEANRRLGRGMNLGNALEAPTEGAWGVTLKPSYFAAIKAGGFATVRLPVKWSAHAAANPPYRIEPKFLERIDWALEEAAKNGLNVVLNVHHYSEMETDPARHAPRLVGLWKQLAHRYRDRSTGLAFEPLNEPHGKLDAAKWNALVPDLLAAIRRYCPARPIVVGPANWNNLDALQQLQLPADPRLIVTFHCYDPFNFTHQGASWVRGAKAWEGKKWDGSPAEETYLKARFAKAGLWGKTNDRPLFLGEFGCYAKADLASRVRWTKFMAREAERHGISWAYWEFCSGFGAFDPQTDQWREPLRAALAGSA